MITRRSTGVMPGPSRFPLYKPYDLSRNTVTMTSHLSSLLEIISSNVAAIEKAYAAHGQPIPSLDDPPRPPAFDPKDLLGPTALVIAAAFQLISTVSPPQMTLMGSTFGVS
jgi:hypothetical protein